MKAALFVSASLLALVSGALACTTSGDYVAPTGNASQSSSSTGATSGTIPDGGTITYGNTTITLPAGEGASWVAPNPTASGSYASPASATQTAYTTPASSSGNYASPASQTSAPVSTDAGSATATDAGGTNQAAATGLSANTSAGGAGQSASTPSQAGAQAPITSDTTPTAQAAGPAATASSGGSMTQVSGGMAQVGVNLSGGEFSGCSCYPTAADVDAAAAAGMTSIRLPFLIQRLEPSPGGAFSQSDLAAIEAVVKEAEAKGMTVILDPHDYGDAWGNEITPDSATELEYDGFLTQLAQMFKGNPNVIFELMNEPNQQTPSQMTTIENDAIAAIRKAGAAQEILVPGTDWDGAWTWVSSGNAAAINPGTIKDPDNNWAVDVHQYLDSDGSGTNYGPITDPNIGVERLAAVTQWAESNGARLFLSEFGVPQDPQSQQALQNMLNYMDANSSVWQGATMWGGGSAWGNYPMAVDQSDLNALSSAKRSAAASPSS